MAIFFENPMNLTLEDRKLSIVASLAEVRDEGIIRQIENLIEPARDFWDELSDRDRQFIQTGLGQLAQGQRTEYGIFLQTYLADKRTGGK